MDLSERHLVIGGTGVIGHFVTRALITDGHRPVVATVSGNTGLIADVVGSVDVVRLDVQGADALDAVLREHGITHVTHMGAVLQSAAERDPAPAVRVMTEGMINVLEAAVRNGVRRVVYTSSKAVYGVQPEVHRHPDYLPLAEAATPSPVTMYGALKLAGEHLGRIYRDRHGLEFAALRFASTVGPAKVQRHGAANEPGDMIERAMTGKPCRIEAGGDARTDILYNGDAAHGILCALQSPSLPSALYNIGTGTGITLHELAEAARTTFPGAEIKVGPGPRFLTEQPGHCVFDIARARDEIGYEPQHDAAGMVRDYAAMAAIMGLVREARR